MSSMHQIFASGNSLASGFSRHASSVSSGGVDGRASVTKMLFECRVLRRRLCEAERDVWDALRLSNCMEDSKLDTFEETWYNSVSSQVDALRQFNSPKDFAHKVMESILEKSNEATRKELLSQLLECTFKLLSTTEMTRWEANEKNTTPPLTPQQMALQLAQQVNNMQQQQRNTTNNSRQSAATATGDGSGNSLLLTAGNSNATTQGSSVIAAVQPSSGNFTSDNSYAAFASNRQNHVVNITNELVSEECQLDGTRTVNQYIILQPIASGTQGTVFLGIDTMSNEFRAIKEIFRPSPSVGSVRAHLAATRIRQRLQHEVDVMKLCVHPHLVTLYEVIDDPNDNSVYLVLNYIDHGPVMELGPDGQSANGKTISLPKVARYGRQLSSALSFLHEHGIVHRDIKPENILLGNDDNVFLGDFGISEMLQKTATAPPTAAEMRQAVVEETTLAAAVQLGSADWTTSQATTTSLAASPLKSVLSGGAGGMTSSASGGGGGGGGTAASLSRFNTATSGSPFAASGNNNINSNNNNLSPGGSVTAAGMISADTTGGSSSLSSGQQSNSAQQQQQSQQQRRSPQRELPRRTLTPAQVQQQMQIFASSNSGAFSTATSGAFSGGGMSSVSGALSSAQSQQQLPQQQQAGGDGSILAAATTSAPLAAPTINILATSSEGHGLISDESAVFADLLKNDAWGRKEDSPAISLTTHPLEMQQSSVVIAPSTTANSTRSNATAAASAAAVVGNGATTTAGTSGDSPRRKSVTSLHAPGALLSVPSEPFGPSFVSQHNLKAMAAAGVAQQPQTDQQQQQQQQQTSVSASLTVSAAATATAGNSRNNSTTAAAAAAAAGMRQPATSGSSNPIRSRRGSVAFETANSLGSRRGSLQVHSDAGGSMLVRSTFTSFVQPSTKNLRSLRSFAANEGSSADVGTRAFLAPEVIQLGSSAEHTEPKEDVARYNLFAKADVWALGCTLFCMVYGRLPFTTGGGQQAYLEQVIDTSSKIEFPERTPDGSRVPSSLRSALGWMMERDPARRWSARQVKQVFRQLDYESEAWVDASKMPSRVSYRKAARMLRERQKSIVALTAAAGSNNMMNNGAHSSTSNSNGNSYSNSPHQQQPHQQQQQHQEQQQTTTQQQHIEERPQPQLSNNSIVTNSSMGTRNDTHRSTLTAAGTDRSDVMTHPYLSAAAIAENTSNLTQIGRNDESAVIVGAGVESSRNNSRRSSEQQVISTNVVGFDRVESRDGGGSEQQQLVRAGQHGSQILLTVPSSVGCADDLHNNSGGLVSLDPSSAGSSRRPTLRSHTLAGEDQFFLQNPGSMSATATTTTTDPSNNQNTTLNRNASNLSTNTQNPGNSLNANRNRQIGSGHNLRQQNSHSTHNTVSSHLNSNTNTLHGGDDDEDVGESASNFVSPMASAAFTAVPDRHSHNSSSNRAGSASASPNHSALDGGGGGPSPKVAELTQQFDPLMMAGGDNASFASTANGVLLSRARQETLTESGPKFESDSDEELS